MDNIGLSLIVGIISSLMATALFIALSELIRRVCIPWYADKIYRGVRIDGDWEVAKIKGKDFSLNDAFMRLSLTQKGEIIKGTYSHKGGKDEEIDEYHLEGKIRDMYFLAIATPKSNRKIDAMSFLLHIEYIGSKLLLVGSLLSQGELGKVLCHDPLEFKFKK